MRFASLGSGSKGNAMVVEAGNTRLLVDCGFGLREFTRRLGRLGLGPADIDGILVTHEHGDHVGGVWRYAEKFGIRIYMTYGTLVAVDSDWMPAGGLEIIDSHAIFAVGDFEVQPFPVPHDAREPVQFVLSDGDRRLGILTDTGSVTQHILARLMGCDGLVIEFNHDAEMLGSGRYPPMLKRRIAGDYGHLENKVAADLLRRVATDKLQHVVGAHLSEHNNLPSLALGALVGALEGLCPETGVADQESGFGWRTLI
ncbi:Putative metallo-hydrolase YycJ [Rhodocyclaceae bacterium]|nr:Putative metallo-hydrolase YycJ [Rhodocyclaceae bacterium]